MRRAAAVRIEPAFAGGAVADDERAQAGAQRKDRIAAALALIAAATIVVNALYLQKGPHPAPILSGKPATAPVAIKVTRPAVETRPAAAHPAAQPQPQPQVVSIVFPRPRPADLGTIGNVPVGPVKAEPVAVQRPPRDVPAVTAPIPRPPDPIGEMINTSSKRVMAVQRALTEFGYGQIRPTGTMDRATEEAIGAFERARKLPVTERITPSLIQELSAMAGRPIE